MAKTPQSNIQSATEREREKTRQQQAEDIAYTLNHSIYCTLTDFLNPPINAATDNYLRWMFPGCGHDHSHDDGHAGHDHPDHDHVHEHHDHGHDHAPEKLSRMERVKRASKQAFSKERFLQYAKGEFLGDFAAVPLTIGVQRLFPGFMGALRALTEPVMRPLFRWGVERESKQWARRERVSADSQAYSNHVAQAYEYEIGHFPLALVWTGFSLGVNTAYQMWADKSPMAFQHKLALKGTSVLSGVLMTAGMVVAARTLFPERMHGIDEWTSSHAIMPATKAIGGLFGVKNEDVDRMAKKEKTWQQRVDTQAPALQMGM